MIAQPYQHAPLHELYAYAMQGCSNAGGRFNQFLRLSVTQFVVTVSITLKIKIIVSDPHPLSASISF